MKTLQFWFEFASTYSYPAAMRIETLARAASVEIEWRPFLLGPVFKAQGWNDSPFNLFPAKGRYMWRDLERVCSGYGLPFNRPSQFPRNGLLAARLACRFQTAPWLPEFVRRAYLANFSDDRDIADADVLGSILRDMQLPMALLDDAQSQDSKRQFREQTETAVTLGIFGAPSFIVCDELFWGNDRLETAVEWSAAGR